jgi:hypothetical protein
VASGEWRVASGEWRVASGGRIVASESEKREPVVRENAKTKPICPWC